MEKENSHVDFVGVINKNCSTVKEEKILNEIYMDLFLKSIHRHQIKKRLVYLIDRSLDNRDELKFLQYTKQLGKFKDII